jgi:hypothetical protein
MLQIAGLIGLEPVVPGMTGKAGTGPWSPGEQEKENRLQFRPANRWLISGASLALFLRGTLAPNRETWRAFAAVPPQVFAFQNRDLASQLASYNFLTQPAENTKAAKWRLVSALDWRGRQGSNRDLRRDRPEV